MNRVLVFGILLLALADSATAQFVVDSIDLGVASWGLGEDDFNNDGRLDFVNRGIDGSVTLFLNNGNRTFSPSVVTTGLQHDGGDIATGDFNLDGWKDFAVVDFSDSIYLFENLHNGSFGQAALATGFYELIGIDASDYDNDGAIDLFALAYNSTQLIVLKGNGLGQFSVQSSFSVNPGGAMWGGVPSVVAGDFNRDGKLDLVAGQDDDGLPGDAWLYAGDGTGNFVFVGKSYDTNPLTETGYDAPGGGVADAFDFNGDGYLDVLASSAEGGPGALSIFYGDATVAFGTSDTLAWRSTPLNSCATPPIGFGSNELFGIGGGPFSQWGVIAWHERNTVRFPSATVPPCNPNPLVRQPVVLDHSAPMKGAQVSMDWPAGIDLLTVSDFGAATQGWEQVVLHRHQDSGFFIVQVSNTSGQVLAPGVDTLFFLEFARPCKATDLVVHFDTALSADPSRRTKFADTAFHTIQPDFHSGQDSSVATPVWPGNTDGDPAHGIDISDLTALIDYLYISFTPNCALINGDISSNDNVHRDVVDIADLSALIDYLYITFNPSLLKCLTPASSPATRRDMSLYSLNLDVTSGITSLTLNSELGGARGLQLELSGPEGEMPVSLAGDKLRIYSGWKGGVLHVGIIDPTGKQFINAGNTPLIQLNGEFKILSATIADMEHRSVRPQIGSSAGTTLPTEYSLSQNYPNPFNPATTISFTLPVAGHVTVKVYNSIGQAVATLIDENRPAGVHQVMWDANKFASGAYLYRLTTDGFTETKKMLLMK